MRPTSPRFPVVRIPSRRSIAVALLAVLTAVGVHRTTASATAALEEYGAAAPVVVVRRDLPIGHQLAAGDLDLVDRPMAHRPADAFDDVPIGAVVTREVRAGDVLTARDLSAVGRSGPGALIPEGWRAVVVAEPTVLPVAPGQRVDVVAVHEPGIGSGRVLVDGAVVVATDGRGEVTVAVPVDAVPTVVGALVGGVVTLALVG